MGALALKPLHDILETYQQQPKMHPLGETNFKLSLNLSLAPSGVEVNEATCSRLPWMF